MASDTYEKIDGAVRGLTRLKLDFEMRGANATTIERANNLFWVLRTALAAERERAEKAEKELAEARAEIERMTPKFVAYEYLEAPDAESALSADKERQTPEGWKPIESALRDGTWVLLYVPGHGPARARYKARMGWESHTNGREITKATHWMPAPSDPVTAP